jgi:flavin reductase (DIM6/NTAB) family NADH-FMN oxidoreductase RutF
VISQVKSGDHTIFVGEVKHSWKNDEKELFFLNKQLHGLSEITLVA